MPRALRQLRLAHAAEKLHNAEFNTKREINITLKDHVDFIVYLKRIQNSNSRLSETQRKIIKLSKTQSFINYHDNFIDLSRRKSQLRPTHQKQSRGVMEDYRQNVCLFCNIVLSDKQYKRFHDYVQQRKKSIRRMSSFELINEIDKFEFVQDAKHCWIYVLNIPFCNSEWLYDYVFNGPNTCYLNIKFYNIEISEQLYNLLIPNSIIHLILESLCF